jgi:formylglycine-generating enzyme required for sulfatase activity
LGDKNIDNDFDVGSVIKGRFKLEKVLGIGGMGKVYKALDLLKAEAKDRKPYVAIKLLNDNFREHPESFIALQREASRQQKLSHPNIATVHDFDRVGGVGTAVYITMELMEGIEIKEFIRKKVRPKNGLPFKQAYAIIKQIGNGLTYAHEHNLVHSDFKPSNAFLCNDGKVKTLDFGIARAVENPITGDLTKTLFDPGKLGALTPAYASHEQLEGKTPDIRDDIYALGCVAYELLTGEHPFKKVPANVAREKRLAPPYIESLNKIQNTALRSAIAFFRDDRSPSVAHFIKEFEGQELIPKPKYEKQTKSNMRLYVGSAIVIALVLGLGIFFSIDKSVKKQKKISVEEEIYVLTDDIQVEEKEEVPIKTLQDELRSGKKGPVMVIINSGTFDMGITSSIRKDEGPRHTVKIKKFAVSQNEISLEEYDIFAKALQKNIPNPKENDRKKYPVNFVSWDDANDYTEWLSKETGEKYRLLSEAEWEYIASTGRKSTFWWGYDEETNRAHCFTCETNLDTSKPTKIGSFKTNLFGIYDTAGNVSEWVHDCWHENYKNAPDNGTVWSGGDCTIRIARGGSFTSPQQSIRNTKREQFKAGEKLSRIGIRIARELP